MYFLGKRYIYIYIYRFDLRRLLNIFNMVDFVLSGGKAAVVLQYPRKYYNYKPLLCYGRMKKIKVSRMRTPTETENYYR